MLNQGDATPPDAALPDAAMASPQDQSPPASPKNEDGCILSYIPMRPWTCCL